MSTILSRAQMLRQHRRHEEAVAMLHSHLGQYPDDPSAFIELALNRMEMEGAKALALEDARKATGLLPNDPFPQALQSRILSMLDREKEALPLAESAIAIDPEDVYSWNAKTLALCGLHRWAEAEQSARHALELDADDETASNLLAHVLRLQKKLDESEQESRRRLARDPDNAFSFANAGWAALQRHQVKEAENFFKEALRLNPEMKYAREGLKESYRARSGFYRLFLRWAFFLQRFSEQNRTFIIIGIVFGFRIIRTIAQSINPALVLPVFLIYYLFLFGSWLASGIANCLVMKDPIARMSLDRGEKVEGLVVGFLFFGGIALMFGGFFAAGMDLAVAGGTMLAAALPFSLVFTNESRMGRAVFLLAGLGVLALGISGSIEVHKQGFDAWKEVFQVPSISFAFLIAMLSTWLAMVPALRQVKPS
ncbi:hypothetical protein [Haloferula sp. BvORR071]|uniref:tetratricopeptide repeat protein n=1 Tax=Haloferula sp. BvORR071 TaxID=1396141 RepID=UPI00054E7C76|nr:hypothetical protein [Haloferula sp. BvORR071]